MLPSSVSSCCLDCLTIKREAVRWAELLVTTYPSTQSDMPQELNFNMHIII
jgi:hypothetical protein